MNQLIQKKYDTKINELQREKDTEINKYTIQNGMENGDFTLVCKDGEMKVFSEVFEAFSDYYKGQLVFGKSDRLDLSKFKLSTVKLVVEDLYVSTDINKQKLIEIEKIVEYFLLADYLLLIDLAHTTFMTKANYIIDDMYYIFLQKGLHKFLDEIFPFVNILTQDNQYFKIIIKRFVTRFSLKLYNLREDHRLNCCSCFSHIPCLYTKIPEDIALCFDEHLDMLFISESELSSSSSEEQMRPY